jgi:hypothetical protein
MPNSPTFYYLETTMKRNKEIYEETLPVFYYQRRELREELETLNQQKIQNSKIIFPKVLPVKK